MPSRVEQELVMPTGIVHFMWGYQTHFRMGQEVVAQRVFGLVDERFDPQLFLVGILLEEQSGWHRACVEPEKDFWIKSKDFDRTKKVAEKIRSSYADSKIIQGHTIAQESHDENLARRSIRDAIRQIINAKADKPSDLSYFVSYPSRVGNYLVSAVLGVQSSVLEAHPSLQKDRVPIHKYLDESVRTSFIDAVIHRYLDKISGELQLPNPGIGFSEINAAEILRDAANSFMTGLAYRAEQSPKDWQGLFSACNKIASTYYEKAVGTGTLILARKNHPDLKHFVEFTNPIGLQVTRAARKLLQLASRKLALHTDASDIYGLARIENYLEANEDLFIIRFLGHSHWQVTHGDQILMRVKFGEPYLIKPPFSIDKLRQDLRRIFHKITDKQIVRIINLVQEAEKEKHGTMLLISADARKESERLRNQGTPIQPKRIRPELLKNLTPIDGAVILNEKATCYSIGTILDGIASPKGNPARGARYNSALRYVEPRSGCMAVVISEDGGVDFFPDLKPAIKRSKIEDAIAILKQMAARKKVNREKVLSNYGMAGQAQILLAAIPL